MDRRRRFFSFSFSFFFFGEGGLVWCMALWVVWRRSIRLWALDRQQNGYGREGRGRSKDGADEFFAYRNTHMRERGLLCVGFMTIS